MKPLTNIAEVQEAGEGLRLPAGGYVCRYTKVNDVPEKEYLYMEFDIAEGTYRGYYADLEARAGFWGGHCYRSYKPNAQPMFKRMCSAVTKSNPGFIFDGNQYCDERTLEGKLVGMILGEEEYIGNDGSVKTRLNVIRECEVAKIREGKFKVPELKKLNNETVSSGTPDFMKVDDSKGEETPFN